MGALGMAEQVAGGNASLTTAVSWHLSSNHFPPVPAFMVPVAIAAIEAGNDEDWDRELELPLGCVEHKVVIAGWNETEHALCELESVVQWRDREDGKARAGDVLESFHLDSFLTVPDDDFDISACACVFSCADDPETACSLSGDFHVHAGDPCLVHPDAPGDR
jgi:hypothetical protein